MRDKCFCKKHLRRIASYHFATPRVALDRVASKHSMPAYPQDARSFRIQREVMVRIDVENGRMVNLTAEST